MSYIDSATEKIESKIISAGDEINKKTNGNCNGVSAYDKVFSVLQVNNLQSALYNQCDSLVKFQQRVMEQIEALIIKISKKEMEE